MTTNTSDKRINILGTCYEVKTVKSSEIDNHAGLCEFYNKRISISTDQDFSCIEDKQRAFRHEIIHAFFHESGLLSFADDEILCDFLAAQFPKLDRLFTDLDIL